MHPRQMARAATWQRPYTQSELRAPLPAARRSLDEVLATIPHEVTFDLIYGGKRTVAIPEADRLAQARLIIREEDGDEHARAEATMPVEDRMTELFAERMRDGLDTDHYDLTREGFSEAEVIQFAATAAGKADTMLRTDVSDDRVSYDREARVYLGAHAVAGMLLTDTGAVNTVLHQAGLVTREIGNLYPDIIGTALRIVRESRPDMAVQ